MADGAQGGLSGRVALDEILNRFPEWEVDFDNAWIAPAAAVEAVGVRS